MELTVLVTTGPGARSHRLGHPVGGLSAGQIRELRGGLLQGLGAHTGSVRGSSQEGQDSLPTVTDSGGSSLWQCWPGQPEAEGAYRRAGAACQLPTVTDPGGSSELQSSTVSHSAGRNSMREVTAVLARTGCSQRWLGQGQHSTPQTGCTCWAAAGFGSSQCKVGQSDSQSEHTVPAGAVIWGSKHEKAGAV
jgi:hypothetical protein